MRIKMRVTTQLLCEHFPENLALLIESYIMEDGYPADMATAGHWELVSEFKEDQLESALYGACRGDSILLVKHILEMGSTSYDFGLLGACCSNGEVNREAGDLMISLGGKAETYEYFDAVARFANDMRMVTWLARFQEPSERDYESILCGGAFTGNMELVNFAVHNGANNWDSMLFNACKGGDTGMILLGLVNGGKPALGLAGASSSRLENVIKWMMRLGAKNYNHGLINAAMENHIDIVLYMLELGADRIDDAFSIAFHNSHFALAHILLTHGATQCTHNHYCRTPWADHITAMESENTLRAFNHALL